MRIVLMPDTRTLRYGHVGSIPQVIRIIMIMIMIVMIMMMMMMITIIVIIVIIALIIVIISFSWRRTLTPCHWDSYAARLGG